MNGTIRKYRLSLFFVASKLLCPGFTPIKESFDYKLRAPNKQLKKFMKMMSIFSSNEKIHLPKSVILKYKENIFEIVIPDNIHTFSSKNYYIVMFNGSTKVPEDVILSAIQIIYMVLEEQLGKKIGIIAYYTRNGKMNHAVFRNAPSFDYVAVTLSSNFSHPYGYIDICSMCKNKNMCLKQHGIEERGIIDDGYRRIERIVCNIKDTGKWVKTIKKIFSDIR